MATKQDLYSASDIQVLEGMEAVRKRPGMYIGGTDQRGVHQLIFEPVDNAIDEFMAGFCSRVDILVDREGIVTVTDDGRGIPVDKHKATGVSALETVMTTLHAGGKFGGKAYSVSAGLHGVGVSAVNALSEWLTVDVYRNQRHYHQKFAEGQPVSKLKSTKLSESDEAKTGTVITFKPDLGIFGEISYDFSILSQRFKEIAYLNKGFTVHFRNEWQAELFENEPQEVTFLFEGGIAEFVESLNKTRTPLHKKPVYIEKKLETTYVEAALQWNDGFSESVFAFANTINNIDGGSHITGIRAAITRVLNDYGRKEKLIKEGEENLAGEDTRAGLAAIVSVKIPEPQFEGQTKRKLNNPEVRPHVEIVVAEALQIHLEDNPQDAKRIIEKCVVSQRARDAARKARELITRKNAMDTGALPGKLADCSDKNPENCELYIVEGDSAGGTAKMGRDRSNQAVLPLRGKILNVEKAREDKMLSHEEIKALIIAIGAGLGEDFDLAKLRYHRIIIMTDADVDGQHIRTLLLTFFFRNMFPLIANGHLYIAQPPLYKVTSGRKQRWIIDEADLEKQIAEFSGEGAKKSYSVQRYKGLGEMSAEQLWDTTLDPEVRTLLKVETQDAAMADELFSLLMGDVVPPRREFIEAHALEADVDA